MRYKLIFWSQTRGKKDRGRQIRCPFLRPSDKDQTRPLINTQEISLGQRWVDKRAKEEEEEKETDGWQRGKDRC